MRWISAVDRLQFVESFRNDGGSDSAGFLTPGTGSYAYKGYDAFPWDGVGDSKPVTTTSVLIVTPDDVADDISTTSSVSVDGAHVVSTINTLGDQDFFQVELEAGHIYDIGQFLVAGGPSGVPLADAYIEIEAANLMRFKAAALFDANQPCGAQANMAKYLAAKASWEAANVCMQTHGGFGFANEYDIERKFRETRLYQVAPISTNLIFSYVAEHLLGLPRSF